MFKVETTTYEDYPVHYVRLLADGLLLATVEICDVLKIVDRTGRIELSVPFMDYATAIELAREANHTDFLYWLKMTFSGVSEERFIYPANGLDSN
jgi:hypothetical protein